MAGNCKLATELRIRKKYVGNAESTTAMASVLGLLIYHCMDLGLHCSHVTRVSKVQTLMTGLRGDLLRPGSPQWLYDLVEI